MGICFKKGILAVSLSALCSISAWAKNNVESIYINGNIYTAVDNDHLQEAIAISNDGTILKVGKNSEIKKLADAESKIASLKEAISALR